MIRLKFWKRTEPVFASAPYDPIEDWITSEDFKSFVRYQMNQEPVIEPSPQYALLDETISSHRPNDLRLEAQRVYVGDHPRPW